MPPPPPQPLRGPGGVPRTAELSIDRVQLSDEAIYRCRVDFKTSRSRNYQVNLTVIGECHTPAHLRKEIVRQQG